MSRETGFLPTVVDLIWRRDRGCCARCGRGLVFERRGVDWAIHHRCPRGAGGVGKRAAWVNGAANGVVLCTGCHEWVESNRKLARADGWLLSRLGVDRASDVAIPHALHGLVWIDDEGGVRTA